MWSRVLLWFRKLPQWNHYVNEIIFESGLRSKGWPQWNCHVNKTSFQSGLRLQNGLCSLWVSCKRALSLVYFGFIFIFLPNGRIVALLLTSIFVKFALIRKEKRWYFEFKLHNLYVVKNKFAKLRAFTPYTPYLRVLLTCLIHLIHAALCLQLLWKHYYISSNQYVLSSLRVILMNTTMLPCDCNT